MARTRRSRSLCERLSRRLKNALRRSRSLAIKHRRQTFITLTEFLCDVLHCELRELNDSIGTNFDFVYRLVRNIFSSNLITNSMLGRQFHGMRWVIDEMSPPWYFSEDVHLPSVLLRHTTGDMHVEHIPLKFFRLKKLVMC